MKSILDPSFRYTPSVATDLRKTFERIRRELCESRESSLAQFHGDVVSPNGEVHAAENEPPRTEAELADHVS